MTSTKPAARRAARVHIDATSHAQVFACTLPVPDQHWNGWECPTFDRANAERVIAWVESFNDDQPTTFRWFTDRAGLANLLMMTDYSDDEVWWDYVGDETTGFSIGAYSWCWYELPADAPTEPAALDHYLGAERDA